MATLLTTAGNGSGFADCRCKAGACDRASKYRARACDGDRGTK
jgi:hypothetical protein